MYDISKGFIGAVAVGLILVVGLVGMVFCLERIPAGYCGVQYSMNGGVKDEVLTQGWHLVSPTTKVKEFTVANEQLILSKDSRNGSEEDESFNVSTADDASISVSFQMSYKFVQEDLVDTYTKFKGMDGEDIVTNRVSAVLKSKISEVTTDYSMMDIYSGNRSEINNKITEYLNKEFQKSFGIEVLDASIIDVHPDAQLQQTIDARVTALQNKQKAQAEQETAKVEAATALIKAQSEADIAVTKAEAQAKANEVLARSITHELIQMKEAEARLKHGWVEVNGASTVVTNK
jgi:regulator of protease activity HflC (stomatin/prohibitin superfamily)